MYKLGIIGVGKMGNAILEGIIRAKIYSQAEILLCFNNKETQMKYEAMGYNTTLENKYIFKDCEMILLAIKPQNFIDAVIGSKDYDFNKRCIISIMAGLKMEKIAKEFKNANIFRLMPNTPALIKEGVTTVCFNKENNYTDKVLEIFNSIGKAYIITEDQMDQTLPLNGSMPAYLFLFAKAFIEIAVKNGVSYDTAKELCLESIISSAKLVLNSNDSIDTLINNVCSKGGTTVKGLNELYNNNFIKAVEECYIACMKRSIELSE